MDGCISRIAAFDGGPENDCYVSDALGSTRLVLKNGNAGPQDVLFSAVTYKPFGAVYSSSVPTL